MPPQTAELHKLGPAPVFCTSGSTGEGSLIAKSWMPLLFEGAFLQGLTQLQPGALVVALVPPFHIFGFLYGVLVPALAGADVVFPTYKDGVLDLPEAVLSDADLVVTVPAIWPALRNVLPAADLPLIISSGAPWDAAREAEFLATKTKHGLKTRLFDVLGSTETGGLGFRELGVSPGAVFSAFAGVELARDPSGGFRLQSPYTEPPLEWMPLADDFVLDPADKRFFVYKGRKDRVFKLGGQRFSLTEIERHLTEILAGAPVRCRFREDSALAKGGELIAYVADGGAGALDFAATRRAYLARYQTPFPTRIFLVEAFRPNAAGKVSLPDLEGQALKTFPEPR